MLVTKVSRTRRWREFYMTLSNTVELVCIQEVDANETALLPRPASRLRSFFSIPYAEPPTGSRRWKAPVPIDVRRSRGVPPIRNATIPGNICLQSGPVWAATQDIGILIYISAQDPGLRSTFGLDSYIQNPNPEPTRPTGEDCLTLDVYIPTQRSTGKLLPVVLQIHGGGQIP